MSIVAKFLDYPELTPFITDMRLQVGLVPWVNINRHWQPHPILKEEVAQEELELFIRETQKINDERDLAVVGRELDFAFSAEVGGNVHRFRGHESRNYQGMAIDIRILRAGCPTMEELGFKQATVTSLLDAKVGLVMIGGTTGSGKSTTLAALVGEFAKRYPGSHIVTLEEPVEYILRLSDCLVSQKHVPVHVESFERGIYEAQREKPSLIVIGELRTKNSIRAAIDAASSGHLVFATTFADRLPRALGVIRDAFSVEEQNSLQNKFSYLFRGLICQELLPRQKTNEKGYALPALVYEALCNDAVWVSSAIRKGLWGRIDLQSMAMGGESVAWEKRVDELVEGGDISKDQAEFLKRPI